MGRDEEVVGADRRAPPLEVRANLSVVERRLLVELHRIDIGQECRQGSRILCAARETSAPYSNSALVTTDMQTSPTGTACSRFSTNGCDRFMV